MAIKALIRIKAGNVIYEPGSIITGLASSEEEELVKLKAAVDIKEDKKEEISDKEKNDQNSKKKHK